MRSPSFITGGLLGLLTMTITTTTIFFSVPTTASPIPSVEVIEARQPSQPSPLDAQTIDDLTTRDPDDTIPDYRLCRHKSRRRSSTEEKRNDDDTTEDDIITHLSFLPVIC